MQGNSPAFFLKMMHSEQENIEWLRQRLQQPLPGFAAQERMMGRVIPHPPQVPVNAKLSAVLCLLYPEKNSLHMLLMKRMEDGTAHSGQVSFPGGRHEPEDESMLATALREANEEVGINPADVDVLGALTSLYIPVSNFNVYPYVGFTKEKPMLHLSIDEVSYTIETPVSHLLDDGNKFTTDVSSPAMPGLIRNVRAYKLLDEGIIWGATAMMISELEVVMKEYSNKW